MSHVNLVVAGLNLDLQGALKWDWFLGHSSVGIAAGMILIKQLELPGAFCLVAGSLLAGMVRVGGCFPFECGI